MSAWTALVVWLYALVWVAFFAYSRHRWRKLAMEWKDVALAYQRIFAERSGQASTAPSLDSPETQQ